MTIGVKEVGKFPFERKAKAVIVDELSEGGKVFDVVFTQPVPPIPVKLNRLEERKDRERVTVFWFSTPPPR
jgi:hypothetical protein